jgi:hypothetical protein
VENDSHSKIIQRGSQRGRLRDREKGRGVVEGDLTVKANPQDFQNSQSGQILSTLAHPKNPEH